MTRERLVELKSRFRPLTESETREVFQEIDRLRQGIASLRECLQWLHDLQNGPPLTKYIDDWNDTMATAERLLKEWGEGDER